MKGCLSALAHEVPGCCVQASSAEMENCLLHKGTEAHSRATAPSPEEPRDGEQPGRSLARWLPACAATVILGAVIPCGCHSTLWHN